MTCRRLCWINIIAEEEFILWCCHCQRDQNHPRQTICTVLSRDDRSGGEIYSLSIFLINHFRVPQELLLSMIPSSASNWFISTQSNGLIWQTVCHLLPDEVPDYDTSGADHHLHHLGGRPHNDHTVAGVLQSDQSVVKQSRNPVVRRTVAVQAWRIRLLHGG